jgi:poly [ADP-ribose] polymerase 2/3/4
LVDASVPSAQNYSVVTQNGISYSCYLMWTDLKSNHNKFYVSQALQHTNGSYSLWTRYGRVGSNGVGSAEPCLSLAHATNEYNKKYRQKVKKGYTEVKMATAKPVEEEKKGEESKDEENKSKLDDSLQNLINFIFDMKLIKQSIVSVGYDVDKLPLGELDKETV